MFRRILIVTVVSFISATLYLSQPQTGGGAGGSFAVAEARNRPSSPPDREITVSVIQQSNPLRKAAEQASHQLRMPVAFEEPAWVADSDLMRFLDTPEGRARPSQLIAKGDDKVRVPALGSVESHTVLRSGQDPFQIAANLLQDCVADHARRGNAGDFKVATVGNYGLSIVPTHVRGNEGQWVSITSPLDSRISFPAGERSLGNTLELIAKTISDTTGEKVRADVSLPGINGIFSVARSQVGAQNETARDVLGKTLREISVEFGPAPMMWFYLEYEVDHKPAQAAYILRFEVVNYTDSDGRFTAVNWPEKTNSK